MLVGPAFTLRYIPAREDLNKLDVFRDRSHPQRKAVEDCPPGAVMVMDSRKDARAASAGAILVTRMMKRGVAGVVTDGGFRNSAEIAALGIPAYHQRPSAPTNLTLHQAIDINVPIGCGDAPVFPGDIILGDQDGVIVIPANLLDEIADETFEMTAYEDFVTEQVRAGKGIFGLYPATDPQSLVDFAAWRKANGDERRYFEHLHCSAIPDTGFIDGCLFVLALWTSACIDRSPARLGRGRRLRHDLSLDPNDASATMLAMAQAKRQIRFMGAPSVRDGLGPLFITVASPSSETWAATMRQPSGVRIQVWLCRPVLLPPWRRNSQLAVPKSRP